MAHGSEDRLDELDELLGAGRVRVGGTRLHETLDETSAWAERRATRRRRTLRAWLAGGVVGGLILGGGGVATAIVGLPAAETGSMITRSYVATTGAVCRMEFSFVVLGSTGATAWSAAHGYLTTADLETLPVATVGGVEDEMASVVRGLERGASSALTRRGLLGGAVHLVEVAHACTVIAAPDDYGTSPAPPVASEEFGRELSAAGRAAHLAGFFRASTGQVCEVYVSIWADGPNSAREVDEARALIATIDISTLDYSDALRLSAERHDEDWTRPPRAIQESNAIIRTVVDRAFALVTTDPTTGGPIRATAGGQCDPEPSA